MEKAHIDQRKNLILLSSIIVIQILGITLSIINDHFGSDFSIYYENTKNFWLNQESYQIGDFFYLNYFYLLNAWVLLFPKSIGLILHIILTNLMFYYIIKHVNSVYELYWFYANLFLILIYSITFNIDIWIVFSFLLFLKYRRKWYSPFFLLLGFFKITPILAFGLIFLIIIYYEREILIKLLPGLTVVFIIIGISFLTSTGLMSSVTNFGNNLFTDMGIIVFFQPPHFCWWSIPLLFYTKFKTIDIRIAKKVWIIYACITLCYGIYILIQSSSVLSDYLFNTWEKI